MILFRSNEIKVKSRYRHLLADISYSILNLYYIQGVPGFFEQNLTKCSLQLLYKHIELHKGMSESV